ncbi:uncharacterized protein BDV14DRAFT_168677 [Aspergillus stella-maris]|uniref:uncharacterized protein n=1 Tax=Aspergillus stella-maris TaxID=1810926 RepID=UPI003CCE0E31
MLVATSVLSDGLHDMRHRDSYNYINFDYNNHLNHVDHRSSNYKIIKQHQGRKIWKMEDNRAVRLPVTHLFTKPHAPTY